jgi:hypothetical protein
MEITHDNSELTKDSVTVEHSTSHQVVSFENIDPRKFEFSLKYQCAKSTAGQVVQGFSHLAKYLNGQDMYDGKKKEAKNKFQEYLYPNMAKLAEELVEDYVSKFVTDVTDSLQKQVFGANLNGIKNDGQLNKFIPCKGISNKFLRYEYAQFGQLLNLLHYRLTFISMRDSMSIKRYVENPEELKHFELLKLRTRLFCNSIKNTTSLVYNFFSKWENIVTEARKVNDSETPLVPSLKLSDSNIETSQNNVRRVFVQRQKYTKPTNTHEHREKEDQTDTDTYTHTNNYHRGGYNTRGRGYNNFHRGGHHVNDSDTKNENWQVVKSKRISEETTEVVNTRPRIVFRGRGGFNRTSSHVTENKGRMNS